MALRPILIIPDSQLRKVSEPVTDFNDEIRNLAMDMQETMYEAPGIGLAAIQIGVPKRVITIDIEKSEETPPDLKIIINPEIIWKSEDTAIYKEGCLSIPEYFEEVERPAEVTVRYQDLDGKHQEIKADGLLATCLQHEIDHLNGVLFIDHLSRLKKSMVMKKFIKSAKREKQTAQSGMKETP